jgi:hypothetical protein
MTAEDVTRRLAAGEDPLELSIEKWEILVERWSDEDVDILKDVDKDSAISASTCALCESVLDDYLVDCEKCPYFLHYGIECMDSHYNNVTDSLICYRQALYDRSEVVSVARAMLDALKEIRDK